MLAYVGCMIFVLDLLAAPTFVLMPEVPVATFLRWFAAGVALHLGWLVLGAGMLGLYLARVYKDTIGLPLYVADPKHSTITLRSHHE